MILIRPQAHKLFAVVFGLLLGVSCFAQEANHIDIEYAKIDGISLKLDLYLNVGAPESLGRSA
jgi:hypothetical protein